MYMYMRALRLLIQGLDKAELEISTEIHQHRVYICTRIHVQLL